MVAGVLNGTEYIERGDAEYRGNRDENLGPASWKPTTVNSNSEYRGNRDEKISPVSGGSVGIRNREGGEVDHVSAYSALK